MTDKRKPKEANDAAESAASDLAASEDRSTAPEVFEPAMYENLHDETWLDNAQAGLNPHTGASLPELPENDDDLLGNGELAIHSDAPDGVIGDVQAIDVRTDGFVRLRFTKADWPVGLRLGTMPREDIRAVTGELAEDEGGLTAWFRELPGDVLFRDGSRVIFRDDPEDGYTVDVK